MVGENFEIITFQMARIAIKLSTMVGGNFEIITFQMARISIKLATMVGEHFEIYYSAQAGCAGLFTF